MNECNIGFFRIKDEHVTINKGRKSCQLEVKNEGERTIQIGKNLTRLEMFMAVIIS